MQGAMIYQMNMCGTCHTINGMGGENGPPLNGVGRQRTKEWLVEHFRDPQKLSPRQLDATLRLPAR